MVFGRHLAENVRLLSSMVDHVEIVIFHTPELHNIPETQEVKRIKELMAKGRLTCSVHLPASLEIAASGSTRRDSAFRLIDRIIARLADLEPEAYILHVPFTAPTLTMEPGRYFTALDGTEYAGWMKRALAGLDRIQSHTGLNRRLLVENINYSPKFMAPFWERGLCALCLDIGHLMLGNEPVLSHLENYLPVIEEIHLHGVVGWEEHLALDVVSEARVKAWIAYLNACGYRGILNLEVFRPEDLKKSLQVLKAAYRSAGDVP
jgi:sugar phosphate isomerase/epimerase